MSESAHEQQPNVLAGSPARFAATLVIALVASGPGLERALTEGESLPTAVIQLLVAFAVLWVLGGIAAVVWHRGATAPVLDVSDIAGEMVPGAAGPDQ